jgi:hypothetical protein
MSLALILAASLVMAAPPPDEGAGEPLPPGAPTDSYELAAWCYGALDEYLQVYDRVIPDLKAIDAKFGTDVKESQPYHTDMAAARLERKLIAESVTDAEKASPTAISERGASAMNEGRRIWSVVETRPRRELARAWMMWALPDRCDSNARELAKRSLLFGKALGYNQGEAPAAAPAPTSDAPHDAAPPAEAPPPSSAPAPGDIDTQLSKPADATAGDKPADPAPSPSPAGDNPAGYPPAKPN